ncbi:hypothetical protein AMQ83_17415 [Paenibacillus riograndensis]|nr:hypothetical protein AMQ83_17415 [Paenibacillus riograndensis]
MELKAAFEEKVRVKGTAHKLLNERTRNRLKTHHAYGWTVPAPLLIKRTLLHMAQAIRESGLTIAGFPGTAPATSLQGRINGIFAVVSRLADMLWLNNIFAVVFTDHGCAAPNNGLTC